MIALFAHDEIFFELFLNFSRTLVTDEQGGSVDIFAEMNKGKYSLGDVKAAFENLATEGMIYSTVDESHYSCVN